MSVLWITVILSLLLALVFLVLFVKEHARFHFGSTERAALLPLEEERTTAAGDPAVGKDVSHSRKNPVRKS